MLRTAVQRLPRLAQQQATRTRSMHTHRAGGGRINSDAAHHARRHASYCAFKHGATSSVLHGPPIMHGTASLNSAQMMHILGETLKGLLTQLRLAQHARDAWQQASNFGRRWQYSSATSGTSGGGSAGGSGGRKDTGDGVGGARRTAGNAGRKWRGPPTPPQQPPPASAPKQPPKSTSTTPMPPTPPIQPPKRPFRPETSSRLPRAAAVAGATGAAAAAPAAATSATIMPPPVNNPIKAPIIPADTPATTAATPSMTAPSHALPTTLPPLPPLPPPAAQAAPAFLRPAGDAPPVVAPAAANANPIPVVSIQRPPTPPPAAATNASGATSPASTPATTTSATTAAPTHASTSSGAAAATATTSPSTSTNSSSSAPAAPAAASPPPSVPTFLRPAPTPLLVRIQQWEYFKHWPNIGYLISAIGTVVSDILWLRSIIILSNLFGIAVNYSFKPPFMIGIRWNFFFILANMIQIARILLDRRDVELTEEEQNLYDALFIDTFSRQEYKKLLNEAAWHDLPPGVTLMHQGDTIDRIHLISSGLCVVEQDRLVPLSLEEVEARRKRGDLASLQTRVVNGQTVSITSPVPASPTEEADAREDLLAAPEEPPSISRTITTALLQGGLSWVHRFRRSQRLSDLDEELEAANSKMGGRLEMVNVEGSPFAVGFVTVPSHTPNAHSPVATTTHSETSASKPASPAVLAPLPSAAAQLTITTSEPAPQSPDVPTPAVVVPAPPAPTAASSLSDVVILPVSAPATAGLPSTSPPPAQHVADSHHLLNVHVDSKHEQEPVVTTTATNTANTTALATEKTGTAMTPSLPVATASSAKDGSREIFPPVGEGYDMLHHDDPLPEEDDVDETQLEPTTRQRQLDVKRSELEKKRASSLTPPTSAEPAAPISNEEVLRSWREDRAIRRAARLAALDRKRDEEIAERERKRLLSRSALERQFGDSAQAPPAEVKPVKSEPDSAATDSSAASTAQLTDPSTPPPVFERHTSTIGFIRPSRLIGEMAMVSPGGAGTADYSVAPVSVTTREPTRVLTWEKASLQRLFFRLPSLAVGWYAVVSTDLVNRLKQQRAVSHQNSYRALLLGVLSDGTVSDNQKSVCAQYRDQYDISLDDHAQALTELGWTMQDWERGSTHKNWFEAWFNKRKGAGS